MGSIEPQQPHGNNNYYNGMYHGGYNLNYLRGYNPNQLGGYNPKFHQGFNPNHLGGCNDHSFPELPTDLDKIHFGKFGEGWIKIKLSEMESLLNGLKSMVAMMNYSYMAVKSSLHGIVSVTNDVNIVLKDITFNHIFKSVKLYRLFRWLYVKFLKLLGCEVPLHLESDATEKAPTTAETNAKEAYSRRILALLGVVSTVPYLISNFVISQAEDATNPMDWRSSGYMVKVIKDFDGNTENEMTVRVNDKLVVAPMCVQSKMNLENTELVYVTGNGGSGLVPIKHLMIEQPEQTRTTVEN